MSVVSFLTIPKPTNWLSLNFEGGFSLVYEQFFCIYLVSRMGDYIVKCVAHLTLVKCIIRFWISNVEDDFYILKKAQFCSGEAIKWLVMSWYCIIASVIVFNFELSALQW